MIQRIFLGFTLLLIMLITSPSYPISNVRLDFVPIDPGDISTEEKKVVEVVEKALKYITNGKFENLLELTEYGEKKRLTKLLKDIESGALKREDVMAYLKSWKYYKITDVMVFTNGMAVVSVRSLVSRQLPAKEGFREKDVPREMEYLLGKFTNGWKIISERSVE